MRCYGAQIVLAVKPENLQKEMLSCVSSLERFNTYPFFLKSGKQRLRRVGE